MRYLLGIGSNVDPSRNIPRILEALLESAGRLAVSRVIETPPVGPMEGGSFLNLAAALDSPRPREELEAEWHALETRLGRDRTDPQRKRRSREADIDCLLVLPEDARRIDPATLPTEPFVRPVLIELLDHLVIEHGTEPAEVPDGVALRVAGREIGERAATLEG